MFSAKNNDAVNDLALGEEGAPGTHKTTLRSPGKLAVGRGQWDASYTKTFSEETIVVVNPTQHH